MSEFTQDERERAAKQLLVRYKSYSGKGNKNVPSLSMAAGDAQMELNRAVELLRDAINCQSCMPSATVTRIEYFLSRHKETK